MFIRISGYFLIAFLIGFVACNNDNPAPKGVLSGKVTVVGTQIALEGINISLSGAKTESKITGIEGLFSFRELGLGDYLLTVGETPSFRSEAPKSYRVRGNQVTVADIQLTPKGRVEGTVIEEGTIDPILGVLVELTGGLANITVSFITGNNGRFVFDGLLDGSYELFVTHPNYANVKKEITITQGSGVVSDIALGS